MDNDTMYKAALASMNEYEQNFKLKQQELYAAQNKVDALTQEINQIRGAYTSLYKLCETFKPKDSVEELTDNKKEEIREKAKYLVQKAKEKGKITKYEDFANSELGKETAVKDISEVANNIDQIDTDKTNEQKEVKPSDTTKLTPEQIAKVSQTLNETKSEVKPSAVKSLNSVKESDIPDYLKDEYKK